MANLSNRITSELNWDALLDLAEAHRVPGLLAQRLEQLGASAVPSGIREKLRSKVRAQHLFTLGMTAELFRILQEFSQAQIDVVLVKGPLLSLLAYGDPAARSYADLDLLLCDSDILRATKHMVGLGFHPDVPESVIRAGKIPGEYVFRRPGSPHLVELHTERTFRYYPKSMRIAELFARRRNVLMDGRNVPALRLEDEFVFDCIHGAKDFWGHLMWVSDIAAFIDRNPQVDWEKVRHASAEAGAERMVRVAIHLANLVTGITPPTLMADEIRRDRTCDRLCRQILTWLPHAGSAPPLSQRAMFRWKMAGGGVSGALILTRLSFSPTHEDWESAATGPRSWIWDALRRPFRLFRKYGSNE